MDNTPEIKLHLIVISITTAIIFFIWIKLTDIIIRFPLLSIVSSGVISVGFYRIILNVSLILFRKLKIFKKWLLGPYYMEGCWIGFFIGNDNTPRFYYEIFEQTLSNLLIRGKSFKENEYHGSWTAIDVYIDIKVGRILYIYETDAIKNTFVNPGLGKFDFERKSPDKPPFRLIGFTSDLYNPNKLKSIEEKVSDDTTVLDIQEALKRSKDLYERYKDII